MRKQNILLCTPLGDTLNLILLFPPVGHSQTPTSQRASPKPRRHTTTLRRSQPCLTSTSSFLLSSIELSDTKVFEPYMRALLGTDLQFCEEVVLKSRTASLGLTDRFHSKSCQICLKLDELTYVLLVLMRQKRVGQS